MALPLWPRLKGQMPFIERILSMIFSDTGHVTDNSENWSKDKIIVIFLKYNMNLFDNGF